MPKTKKQFLRFHIINEALRHYSWVKTTKLRNLIEEQLEQTISLRIIQLDIRAMQEDANLGYYAPIEYDNKKKAYCYTDRDFSINNFALQADEINALKFYASCLKIYSKYGIFKDFTNAIQKIVDGVKIKHSLKPNTNPNLIVQTDTEFHVNGVEFLTQIVQAIDEQCNIEIVYKKYKEDKAVKRIVSPYLLKEYKNRWYLLGVVQKESRIKTFGLDRIVSMEMAPQTTFIKVDFDQSKYFKHSFGITKPNDSEKRIVLEFTAAASPYIKSLPIHPSQQILNETNDILQISIEVIPSYELYEFILSKTPDVRVISPKKIADKIQKQLRDGLNQYNKK